MDLIVTVALGSTYANSVLSGEISVAQSLVGFVMLIGLQFVIAFAVALGASCGSSSIRNLHFGCFAENSFTMRCADSASPKRISGRPYDIKAMAPFRMSVRSCSRLRQPLR
ncbi:hypothetical protein [Bradyrhizobium sp. 23AC]